MFGSFLMLSPLGLHWFIHGDYDRYIWIIHWPFPFSAFGWGPFQLLMHASLFTSGLILIVIGVFLRKEKQWKIDTK
jgi:hypothetical protein